MSLAVWLGEDRKCCATVVGLDLDFFVCFSLWLRRRQPRKGLRLLIWSVDKGQKGISTGKSILAIIPVQMSAKKT